MQLCRKKILQLKVLQRLLRVCYFPKLLRGEDGLTQTLKSKSHPSTLCLQCALQRASLDISRALKMSVRGLPVEWKRPPGRPRHTWLCTLGADLQPHNHGLNLAWRCAQDREHWKHLVETATLQLGACA